MNIVFRTDSSYQIGIGHLMRGLTLAENLAKHEAQIYFICRDLPGNCSDLVEQKKFSLHKLPYDSKWQSSQDNLHKSWLGEDWQKDAEQTIEICKQLQPIDWLVVDSYSLDTHWEQVLRPHVKKIMVIDDIADRKHDCDLILDQNLYENSETRYDELVPTNCIKLLGPKYVLLRDEFIKQRGQLRQRDGTVKRILIFFGGADPDNVTKIAIDAVNNLGRDDIITDVVVGAANKQRQELKTYCSRFANFNFHEQITNMAELMAKADLAIGAGGTTTWERCCLGLPSIAVPIAKNQESSVNNMKANAFIFGLDKNNLSVTYLIEILRGLLHMNELLVAIGEKNKLLIDGKGCNRLTDLLLSPTINVRKAVESDCEIIFNWRNHPSVRLNSFNKDQIEFSTHQKWYKKILLNDNEIILIGEKDDKSIGVLRYKIFGDFAETSIYLAPQAQGLGYGALLLNAGSKWLKKTLTNTKYITAEVLPQNEGSKKSFIKAGFNIDKIVLKKEI